MIFKRNVWELVVTAVLLISACTGCAPQQRQESDGKLNITVSIVPQQYFVDRIGGEFVSATVMVEPGANPATYEPKPEQLKALSTSQVYFSIGVPFENVWLEKIAEVNPDMLMVNTIAGIERISMATQHTDGENNGDIHGDGAPDPHVWVSPELVKVQSQIIYETISQLDPGHKDVYKANFDVFIKDIDALEVDIRQTLSGLRSHKFLVFHPSWGYFAHDFGLEQIPIEVGGQEPSAQELANIIEYAKQEGIQVVFAQPEFSTQDAETISEEIGGKVLLISPLAPDWLQNMRLVAKTFADTLNQ